MCNWTVIRSACIWQNRHCVLLRSVISCEEQLVSRYRLCSTPALHITPILAGLLRWLCHSVPTVTLCFGSVTCGWHLLPVVPQSMRVQHFQQKIVYGDHVLTLHAK